MLKKLQEMNKRYEEIELLIVREDIIADRDKYSLLLKERSRLNKTVSRYKELLHTRANKEHSEAFLKEYGGDPEMAKMAKEEIGKLDELEKKLLNELEEIMLDSDDKAHNNVIVEIRPGTGGDEAAIFAGDVLRMYTKYIERRGWRMEVVELSPSELGGIKQAIFSAEGDDIYRFLKYESGGHRVQRVPKTETQGRIHTSACTVAVLPEPEDVDIEIKKEDIRIDTYRAGGAGGQHVNKTDSAVRITHIPTGAVVACQSERSQHKNKSLAMKWLKAKLYEHEESQKKAERDRLRKTQVGSGDRSEKVRTYNYPQNRVTDHRIGFSVHNLDKVLDGDLDELVKKLQEAERAEKIKLMSSANNGDSR